MLDEYNSDKRKNKDVAGEKYLATTLLHCKTRHKREECSVVFIRLQDTQYIYMS